MWLEINAHGDVQVAREILRFSHRAKDATPAWDALIEVLAVGIEARQFETGGRRSSGGWAKLKDSTIAEKARSKNATVRGNAEKPLLATERLKKSLTAKIPGEDAIRTVTPEMLRFGTRVPYAEYHQLGRGVPQRRPLELTEFDRRAAMKLLQRYIVTGHVMP